MIQYRTYGSGNPLLFIHGFCEDSTMWNGFYPSFSNQYKVYLIDLPGFGNSPLPKQAFSIHDVAVQLAQWMSENQLEEAILIGHSLGGYVSLELAKHFPDLVGGLVLFHSTAFADSAQKREARNKVIDFVQENGVLVFAESFVPQLFSAKNRKRLGKDIDTAVDTAKRTALETLVAYTRAMRDRNDRTDVLKTLSKPILFIAGDQDTSVPLDKSEAQGPLMSNGVLHVLHDCAHMGMFESRSESEQIITKYLSDNF